MLFDELKGARRVNYNRDWCGDRSLLCLCCQQLVGALGGVLGTRLLLHNRQRTGPPPLVTPVMQLQGIQYTAVRVVTESQADGSGWGAVAMRGTRRCVTCAATACAHMSKLEAGTEAAAAAAQEQRACRLSHAALNEKLGRILSPDGSFKVTSISSQPLPASEEDDPALAAIVAGAPLCILFSSNLKEQTCEFVCRQSGEVGHALLGSFMPLQAIADRADSSQNIVATGRAAGQNVLSQMVAPSADDLATTHCPACDNIDWANPEVRSVWCIAISLWLVSSSELAQI